MLGTNIPVVIISHLSLMRPLSCESYQYTTSLFERKQTKRDSS